MSRYWSLVVFSMCLLASLSAAATELAPAANSKELRPRAGEFSIAALFGYGYGDNVGLRGNRLAFGYGGRAGYSFEASRLYLGVTVVAYRDELKYDDTPETGTKHQIDVNIDIGAELDAGPLILRPYLGCGTILVIFEGPRESNSAIVPGLSPGVLARYPLGPLDIGLDARLELYGRQSRPISALGHVGVAF
jgi:hypothetical protein